MEWDYAFNKKKGMGYTFRTCLVEEKKYFLESEEEPPCLVRILIKENRKRKNIFLKSGDEF